MSKRRVATLPLIHYDLIDGLDLPIPLGVNRGGIHIAIVTLEGLTIKLKAIIQDECMRDPKPSDNVLPCKFLCIHVFDIHQWFNFNSLGEVIHVD